MSKIAAIRIRGMTGIRKPIKDTMSMLRLYKKNTCSVYETTPSIKGMLLKAKDFITWGEIDEKTYDALVQSRGIKAKDKEGKEIIKPFFRLNPPKGGFERKGIKVPYASGGALGYRGKEIKKLIEKMM